MYSNTYYLSIPSKKNTPKLMLAVGSIVERKNSFELYNPSSKVAKFFKFLFFYFSFFYKHSKKKTPYVKFLEKRYTKKITTSVLISSCRTKAVIQIQSKDQVVGYIKYALNNKGNIFIANEIKAYKKNKSIYLPKMLDFGSFKNRKFVFIENILCDTRLRAGIKNDSLLKVLATFETKNKFRLKDHPRIKILKSKLHQLKIFKYDEILNNIINTDNKKYKVVSEHGDFTNWNIIINKNKIFLIDHESFIKDGLEKLDYYHYIFTDQLYIKKVNTKKRIENVMEILGPDSKSLFFIYLISRISFRIENNFDVTKYESSLKYFINSYLN